MPDDTQEPKANPKNSHTEQEWQKKFFAMDAKCHYCGKGLSLKEATRDHRTPKCRGGSDRIWNIVPACLPCNQKKGWRTEAEFLRARPVFDQERKALSTNPQPRPAIDKPKPCTLSGEEMNEPGLLKKLTFERERVSWAWRNPA